MPCPAYGYAGFAGYCVLCLHSPLAGHVPAQTYSPGYAPTCLQLIHGLIQQSARKPLYLVLPCDIFTNSSAQGSATQRLFLDMPNINQLRNLALHFFGGKPSRVCGARVAMCVNPVGALRSFW